MLCMSPCLHMHLVGISMINGPHRFQALVKKLLLAGGSGNKASSDFRCLIEAWFETWRGIRKDSKSTTSTSPLQFRGQCNEMMNWKPIKIKICSQKHHLSQGRPFVKTNTRRLQAEELLLLLRFLLHLLNQTRLALATLPQLKALRGLCSWVYNYLALCHP